MIEIADLSGAVGASQIFADLSNIGSGYRLISKGIVDPAFEEYGEAFAIVSRQNWLSLL